MTIYPPSKDLKGPHGVACSPSVTSKGFVQVSGLGGGGWQHSGNGSFS